MAELSQLKISRRNLKGGLTRILTSIDRLVNADPPDTQVLQSYVTKAKEQFQKVELKHDELVSSIEDEEAYGQEEQWMTDCEEAYLASLLSAGRCLETYNAAESRASRTPSPSSRRPTLPDAEQEASQSTVLVSTEPGNHDVPQTASTPTHSAARQETPISTAHQSSAYLPPSGTHAPKMTRMKFPTFSGAIEDYERFKEFFQYCTQGLTEMESFFQLTESMINHKEKVMVKSCATVERAWEVLDARYGDQDRLVDSLLKDLDNLKSYELKGRISVQAMTRFIQVLQNFECRAESMGLSGELNSKIMLSSIKQKLPEEHRMGYYQSVRDKGTGDSLSGLSGWLREQLLLIEKCRPSTSNENTHTQNPRASRSLHAAVKQNVKGSYAATSKCPVHPAASTHYLKMCNTFRKMSLKEKHEVMKKHNVCSRCGHDNCIAGKPPYDHSACQFVRPCGIKSCGDDRHFSSICPVVYEKKDQDQDQSAQRHPSAPPPRSFVTSVNTNNAIGRHDGVPQIILPTIMGYLRRGNHRHLVRILLDSGSQATLLREGIFPRNSRDTYQDYDLSLVGGSTIKRKLRLMDCILEDVDGNWSCPLTVTEINKPCGEAPMVTFKDLQEYSHLREVNIHPAPSETVDVLLGVDNTHLMVWEDYIQGRRPEDPVAVRSPLGWYIQGGRSPSSTPLVNYLNVSAIGPLEEFIGLETAGLEPKRCKCTSDFLDKGAIEAMEESVTQRQDGSYEIRLPWKRSPEELPDNYCYAVKRLNGLERQFKDRPDDWGVYCKQMDDQLRRGVSRHVTEEELRRDRKAGKKMWFLPHFAVKKDSETTPVRVVYDAKSRYQGHSLNDYLSKGENLNSELFNVALRFRENEVGIIADIKKMFQAVKIRPEDARFHRFVFRENPDQPIRVYELTTVTFGDKPSPAAAIVTLRHVVGQHAPGDEGLKKVVTDQFYMDDLSESVKDVSDALELKSKLTKTLEGGNFNIRKWQSNKKEVCDAEQDTTAATILGTKWNLTTDRLTVKAVKPVERDSPTKRKILAYTASYYDVFGMLSGLLIRPKILLQKLWQLNVDWDTPLQDRPEICNMLRNISSDLEEFATIEIPRCLIPERYRGKRPLPQVSIHGASDASEDAMGLCVWLRWSHTDSEEAELSFVCARARVTPLKQSTIPRKELQALLLLSRLMITVKNALRLDIAYCKLWTDSMTVISWLRGQSKAFRSYVACRVGEITTEFDPYRDVAYVPTGQNAADLISRGGTISDMKAIIKGPEYLRLSPESWPKTPENVPVKQGDPERKKFHSRNSHTLALRVNAVSKNTPFLDETKFSSWTRLQMVTARVLSLKELPKKQWMKQLVKQIAAWPSQQMLKEAELYWIRQAQKTIDFQDPHVLKLDPFFDEDSKAYRVGGRLSRAPLSLDNRHPYLLPKNSHISLLFVRDRHAHALHGGYLRTAIEVRKRFWIIGDVNISRRVVRSCIICRRHRGIPVQQKMADLPEFRVSPCSPPFKTTIVDYLGPVSVKLNRNTTTKGYCAVFTCAVTRAVHLTLVQDLSTQAFLQALERFVSIRGAPAMLISDNATCFRGADNTINELNLKLDQPQIREHCLRYKVQWKFGPPAGPHHQGAVERMVQEVKRAMRHLVKADRLSFAEWETVFCQISGLINSRPLTAMSSSPLDHPPLTPNHFLIGRGDLTCPEIPCEEYRGNLRKRRELCNMMVSGFWSRWMECTRKLTPRQKWQKSSENLQENDIVLVIGEDKKRGSWKMAEVVSVHPGEDEFVRVVEVKFADGTQCKRPVTKLVILMKKEERSDI